MDFVFFMFTRWRHLLRERNLSLFTHSVSGPSLPVPVELVSGDVFIDAPECVDAPEC